MNKERIFRQLYANEQTRDAYLEKVPKDLYDVVIFNGYVDNLLHERDMLIRLIFDEHATAIEWFLYEWKPGFEVGVDGMTPVPINSIDEYIEYMKNNEGFK